MTWNIRSDKPEDGEHSWPHRKDLAADLIRSVDPDLAGLQEVLPRQLEDLESALPQYYRIGDGREGGGSGEYCPILYRADRITLLRDGTFWLSDTPDLPGSIGWDAAHPRIATWGSFQHQETGEIFFHFNTHLDSGGSESRRRSTPLLLDVMRMEAESAASVLSGDFNLTDDREEYRMITERMRDSRSAAGNNASGPEITFIGPGFEAGKHAGRRIDYLFVTDDFEVRSFTVRDDSRKGFHPSDHFPVIADLHADRR